MNNPNLNEAQKSVLIQEITKSVMVNLGYLPNEIKMIYTDEKGQGGAEVKGFYSLENKYSYINLKNNNTLKDLVATTGTEAQRAMDTIGGIDITKNRDDNSIYALNFGESLSRYYGYALGDTTTYANAKINNPVNINLNFYNKNNREFSRLDKEKGANRDTFWTLNDIQNMRNLDDGNIQTKINSLIQYGLNKYKIANNLKNTAEFRALTKNGMGEFDKIYDAEKEKVDKTNNLVDTTANTLEITKDVVGGGFIANAGTKGLSKLILNQEAKTSVKAGLTGATIDASLQVRTQIYDQAISNNGYVDFRDINLNYPSILFSAVAGSVAIPSALKSYDSIKYSCNAIKELKDQLKTAVSPNKREQINNKILEHEENIKAHWLFQISDAALRQGIKYPITRLNDE